MCTARTYTGHPDIELINLGRLFQMEAAELDRAINSGANFDFALLQRLDAIEGQILTKNAATIEGFRVKARIACWARLGDFDAGNGGERMAISIVRDLIRAFDPDLEAPGALRRIVEDAISNIGGP
jgi:hypothetical protein